MFRLRQSVLFIALVAGPWPVPAFEGRQVAGYVERALVYPGALSLQAKIDTGADHSSLNAANVERFERDGRTWVRFEVTSRSNRTVVFDRPVERTARIRRLGMSSQERDVLLLRICLGTVLKEVEVNIVDRRGFDYQLLIGRSYLNGEFVIDPSATFLLEPSCPPPKGQ